ncbi:MAG: hypothetical protein JOZ08_06700 [Verrucomicrobia bacterium]|nr:hypothetical protein [Verrucomicrobiota bacterium]MBV8280296.1 hypothetical protein [Verrucomicrobiota bacterium]
MAARFFLSCVSNSAVLGRRPQIAFLGRLLSVSLLLAPSTLFADGSATAGTQVNTFGSIYPSTSGRAIEEKILTSPNSEPAVNQNFGYGLAIYGNTIVAGEPNRTVNGQLYVGAGYVYVEPKEGWGTHLPIPVAELSASDASTQIWPTLGFAVGISGDTIVLGCAYDMGNGSYTREMYVYVKPASGWKSTTESARLQSPSARFQLGGEGGIAIYGDTIAAECVDTAFTGIGSAGAVAIYIKPKQGWTGDIMPVAILTDGGSGDSLGFQIGISGDTIAVAAPLATVGTGGPNSGVVQIYEKPAGGWVTTDKPTATLQPSDPDGGYLGYSMGISGDTLVAGCPYALVNGQYYGAAYVFHRKGSHWESGTQTAKLTAATAEVLDGTPAVGIGVAIQGDKIAVGANGATPPNGAWYGGELFVYKEPSTGWHDTSHWNWIAYDPNAESALQLGISAGISGETVVTGAYAPDADICNQGAVYIFRVP